MERRSSRELRLTYAVIEASDAALAEILSERPLTHEEAVQVGRGVVAALTVLHANGLVIIGILKRRMWWQSVRL